MYTMERLRRGRWRLLGYTETPPVDRLNRVINPKGWGVTNTETGERWECRNEWEGLVKVRSQESASS